MSWVSTSTTRSSPSVAASSKFGSRAFECAAASFLHLLLDARDVALRLVAEVDPRGRKRRAQAVESRALLPAEAHARRASDGRLEQARGRRLARAGGGRAAQTERLPGALAVTHELVRQVAVRAQVLRGGRHRGDRVPNVVPPRERAGNLAGARRPEERVPGIETRGARDRVALAKRARERGALGLSASASAPARACLVGSTSGERRLGRGDGWERRSPADGIFHFQRAHVSVSAREVRVLSVARRPVEESPRHSRLSSRLSARLISLSRGLRAALFRRVSSRSFAPERVSRPVGRTSSRGRRPRPASRPSRRLARAVSPRPRNSRQPRQRLSDSDVERHCSRWAARTRRTPSPPG